MIILILYLWGLHTKEMCWWINQGKTLSWINSLGTSPLSWSFHPSSPCIWHSISTMLVVTHTQQVAGLQNYALHSPRSLGTISTTNHTQFGLASSTLSHSGSMKKAFQQERTTCLFQKKKEETCVPSFTGPSHKDMGRGQWPLQPLLAWLQASKMSLHCFSSASLSPTQCCLWTAILCHRC